VQKHDPILDYAQITPSARIATVTHGWRAKCLQRLVRLDLPVPMTVALPAGTVRAIAQGGSVDCAGILRSSGRHRWFRCAPARKTPIGAGPAPC
jgi:pyruvate, orthophosphate dikinase